METLHLEMFSKQVTQYGARTIHIILQRRFSQERELAIWGRSGDVETYCRLK